MSMENCEDPIEAKESADQILGDINESQVVDGKVMQQFKQCLDISLSNFYSSIRYKLNVTLHKILVSELMHLVFLNEINSFIGMEKDNMHSYTVYLNV